LPKKTDAEEVAGGQAEELLTIEELAERNRVPRWVMAGLKVAYGWGEGKQLTEKEFTEAVKTWLSGPMAREVK
jgi:hypothetical protein